jgi:hypothetical protein
MIIAKTGFLVVFTGCCFLESLGVSATVAAAGTAGEPVDELSGAGGGEGGAAALGVVVAGESAELGTARLGGVGITALSPTAVSSLGCDSITAYYCTTYK